MSCQHALMDVTDRLLSLVRHDKSFAGLTHYYDPEVCERFQVGPVIRTRRPNLSKSRSHSSATTFPLILLTISWLIMSLK